MMKRARLGSVAVCLGVCGLAMSARADEPPAPRYPAGADVPKHMTPAERAWLDANPFAVRATAPSVPPTGDLICPGEYAPMDGIIFSYQGGTGTLDILRQMVRWITTAGNAKAYINVTSTWSTATRQSFLNQLAALGADVSKVELVSYTTDAIWLRDYGPRYVYEGDVRVILDHDYNIPSRTRDDAQPVNFSSYKRHARYHTGLVHGGGNYHLDSIGRGHATRLIVNENTAVGETNIRQRLRDYWGVDTTFYNPFRTSIDGTQHIDMWMQVIDDDKVMISDWPNNSGSIEDVICDNAAVSLAAEGYQVFRVPAFSLTVSSLPGWWGPVHFTYTNVLMCNDVVCIPSYNSVSSLVAQNAIALATWQAAMPDKTIVQIDSDELAWLSGVMHCIVMHMPVHKGAPGPNGGQSPTALVRFPAEGQSITPGVSQTFRWIADDDAVVQNFDLLLSRDGGATFTRTLASGLTAASTFDTSNGSFRLTTSIPAGTYYTERAVLRVVARDALGNTGVADSGEFTINGPACESDYNESGGSDLADLVAFLEDWTPLIGGPANGARCDLNGDDFIDLADLIAFVTPWQAGCP